jgi:hypothetical protein
MSEPGVPTPSGFRARLLGWLVLLQFAVIPLANLLEFAPRTPPLDSVQSAVATWTAFAGQEQGWTTFTMGFPQATVVPVVDGIAADGRQFRQLSRFDPEHPRFRLPIRDNREFNLEAALTMIAWHRPDDLPQRVQDHSELIEGYLLWKAQAWPRYIEATLSLRVFPFDASQPALEWPLARLRPTRPEAPHELRLEAYDPATQKFVALKKAGGP